MGVFHAHPSVCGPARVADTRRRDRRSSLQRVVEVVEASDGPSRDERRGPLDADAGRVVPPVLEAPKACKQDVRGVTPPDVADQSAHDAVSSLPEVTAVPGQGTQWGL